MKTVMLEFGASGSICERTTHVDWAVSWMLPSPFGIFVSALCAKSYWKLRNLELWYAEKSEQMNASSKKIASFFYLQGE